jgi:hypothetical protein
LLRRVDVKRLTLSFILILYIAGNIILLASPCVKSGVKVSPAELIITIEEFPEKEIQYKIKIANPYATNVHATVEAKHPYNLSENYTNIPDLTWVKILPDTINVPPKSSKEFEILIDIPENEKTIHNNKSWETWIIVTPKIITGTKSSVVIQVQLGVKLFINTPTGTEKSRTLPPAYILYPMLGVIVGFIVFYAAYFHIKNKKNIKANENAIFYFKKNKST